MNRYGIYAWLTAPTCWGPATTWNTYPRRCLRFWTAKLLGLHRQWRRDLTISDFERSALERWLPPL